MCNWRLTAGIMSRIALFRALCVKGGTHPEKCQPWQAQQCCGIRGIEAMKRGGEENTHGL
jgi:hypothetical protein